MTIAAVTFWLCVGLIVYVYAGYPVLLLLWSRLRPRPVRRGETEPPVSLVLAVRGGREKLEAKLENLLALDYPPDRLQIVVSLDGPSPDCERVAERFALRGVELVRSEHHQGKAAALNRGVARCRGELIVFCDARQRLSRGAVRALVANFADLSVGAASGELVLLDDDGAEAADGVGLYWRYEKALRALESRIHSTVGATGALYAIRRQLYRPLPEGTLLDDVLVPMRIVLAGRRTVFEPGARAYDFGAPPDLEFTRKVRTLAGNFQLLELLPALLDPRRNPVFLQYVSHKLGRLLVPYLLVLLFVANLFLLEGVYLFFLAGQCIWYLLATVGALMSRQTAPTSRPTAPSSPQGGPVHPSYAKGHRS